MPAPPVTLQGESGSSSTRPRSRPPPTSPGWRGAGRRAARALALADGLHRRLHGLREGELFALTAAQVDPAARVIDGARKVIEVAAQLTGGAPKGLKRRKTIYLARTPHGYPLAGSRCLHRGGPGRAGYRRQPARPLFPSPALPGGGPGVSIAASWPSLITWSAGATSTATATGPGTACATSPCTTALFTWKLYPADVSPIAGDADVRTTLDM